MNEAPDKEDILIRRLLIGGATLAILTFVGFATLVAVMVSANFNILEWME